MSIVSKKKALLVCEECLSRNYTLHKSTLSQRERLVIKKFCNTCNARTIHKESR
ncbi:50S ribosomal protein L33 [Spiroplasma helicoides]|uniref:Large ribosomal subunit protein bL33 n=1 Tax=Spiroplasma helicoides TaxID=216938 RepID=A0A1B3SJ84_9MOLU|nr:50S ribosomal protein L33 [Spiroplasma helicoides]AOG59988.1 50S ribosomal protein L33 [Spiroplasma helicoides]